MYIVGIDVGGTTVKVGKFDLDYNLLDSFEVKTNKDNNGENILSDVFNAIKEKMDINEVKGYGFGVPGPVKDNVVYNCVNLGWGTLNVEEAFRKVLNDDSKVVVIDNDANVAALGELINGAAKGARNAIMVTLGTGVGGGIIVNSTLVQGAFGGAGEIGHITIDEKYGFMCNCGKKGCLETISSATGIVRVAKKMMETNSVESELRNIQNLTCKDIFDYAKENDELALNVVEEISSYLGKFLSMMAYTTNPEVIIIGGGVSKAGDILKNTIKKHFDKYVSEKLKETNIVIATLGNDAGIVGAAGILK